LFVFIPYLRIAILLIVIKKKDNINNKSLRKIRIAIIGTRGIPVRYGGFETFAEEISELLLKDGFDVSVQCDAGSFAKNEYNGVKLFFSSTTKTKNPIKYCLDGLKWAVNHSDIIFANSSHGSIFYFLKYLKKKIIITNTDGLDYKRAKWPLPHKIYLKFSEFLAVLLSDYLIADSAKISDYLISQYPGIKRKIRIIEYGAPLINSFDQRVMNEFNVNPGQYYLVVSRLEPENNIRMIIEGFKLNNTVRDLIIVGNIIDNKYINEITSSADDKRIRFVGGIYDKAKLSSLRFACKAYIHGHSVGGTNPSLLEAMGCGNLVLCHDNVFNRNVTDDCQFYFKTPEELCNKISQIELLTPEETEAYSKLGIKRIVEHYNWETIFVKYKELLNEITPGINTRHLLKEHLDTLKMSGGVPVNNVIEIKTESFKEVS
jgi:glycosyltransferase involved in cell wall biosynthesis